NGSFRVFAKGWDTDRFTRMPGRAAAEGWSRRRTGFRTDWGGRTDTVMVEGEAYAGGSASRPFDSGTIDISGFHLLGRWNRRGADDSDCQLQAYIDRKEHEDPLLLDERGDVYDLEVRHLLPRAGAHALMWGAGVRH